MFEQARAILWAQWRIIVNWQLRRRRGGLAFAIPVSLVWYGTWAGLGFASYSLCGNPGVADILETAIPLVMLLIFVYWQVAPVLAVSAGASLDLRRLLAYPVEHRQLYLLELLLRLPLSVEMLFLLTGIAAGLCGNSAISSRASLIAFPLYALFNLLFSAGVKSSLEWMFQRKGAREAIVFLLILTAALPQLVLSHTTATGWRMFKSVILHPAWPWTAPGSLALGHHNIVSWGMLLFWPAATYFFGRRQFERSLVAEAAPAGPKGEPRPRSRRLSEKLLGWPSAVFPQPLGGIVERELRSLSRAPRFRLVFFMGFTFGLLIWVPLLMVQSGFRSSAFGANFLVLVSSYALLLLGEITIWNSFGIDRSATQEYFLIPVPVSTVLIGKNVAAIVYVILEVALVTSVCAALRLPVPLIKIPETFAVILTWSLYLLGSGNLSSVYFPHRINPEQSWTSSSRSKMQALLLLVYPVLAIPVLMAYLARYAFEAEWAFYGALAFAAGVGAVFYWVALESARQALHRRRELFLSALSEGEGPVVM